jgi:N-acetylglucosamine kinase-like BadF-type ATPase
VGVIGVDGGNSKTELLLVTVEGEPLAYVRGPGSNSHTVGTVGCVDIVARLVECARASDRIERGAFFLCGADVPADIAALQDALAERRWGVHAIVENDTFALLRVGTDEPDAVAVVCGAGINCVGRRADGGTVRYPSLGWETGDWGGSEMLGREVLFLAARAEDGRGERSSLVDVVCSQFGVATVAELGEAIHYKRIDAQRLGELAPRVVAAGEGGDAVARRLVERLADEVVSLALRALRDLRLDARRADVVLGGGMLRHGRGLLHEEVLARLAVRAPKARPVVASDAPVLGAAFAALDAVRADSSAHARLRAALREGLAAEDFA